MLPNHDPRIHYHTHTPRPYPRDHHPAAESAGKLAEPRRTTLVLPPLQRPFHPYGFSTHGPRGRRIPPVALRSVSGFKHPPANPAAPSMFYFIIISILFRFLYGLHRFPPTRTRRGTYLVQFYIYLLCLYDTQVPVSRYGVVRRSRLPGPKMASGGWRASAQRDQRGAGSARVRGTERGRPGNAIMTGFNLFRFQAILGLI